MVTIIHGCNRDEVCARLDSVTISQNITESTVGRFIRRGVRSDAQLSPTETRFQKCSQSGKNGSKHPMLSISMAYNVISCKKIERNTQKIKITDFTM